MNKVVLSFDDGRKDTVRAYSEILKPLGLSATFNVTIGYIDKSINEEDYPSMHEAMSIDELLMLAQDKRCEIAGHGYKHNNELDNLVEGVNKLNEYISDYQTAIGIASPQSKVHYDEILMMSKELERCGVRYFRTGDRKEEMLFLSRVIRKINRKVNIPFFYYMSDSSQFIKKSDEYVFYSNCILKNTSLKELKYTIRKIAKSKKYMGCILNFHSILKPGEDFYEDLWTWDYNDFYEFCIFLAEMEKRNRIQVVTNKELIYVK